MTEYFILLPDDKPQDLTDANLLGTVGLHQNFWPSQGFNVLKEISHNNPDLLSEVKIINSKSTNLTVEEFLNMLDTLNIKTR